MRQPPPQVTVYNKFAKKATKKYLELGQSVMAVPAKEMAVVKYIGHTDFAPGLWIGLELRNPKGDNCFGKTCFLTSTKNLSFVNFLHQGSTLGRCRDGGTSPARRGTG